MALTVVHATDVIYASTINQVVNVLHRLSGQTETGHYFIAGNLYRSTSIYASCVIITLSRNSTPVSITVDASDTALSSLNTLKAGFLTQGSAQIYASGTAITANCFGGGLYTMQY